MEGRMHHMCGSTSLAEAPGRYLVRFLRRLMWSPHLGVVLDLAARVLSGLVPLVTGKIFWRLAEDSGNYTSEAEY